MTTKLKKVYNVKLLYRWQAPQWFAMLFIAMTIAIPALALFMPYFEFIKPGETSASTITGLEMTKLLFGTANENVTYIIDVFNKTLEPKVVASLMPYIFMAIGPLFMLIGVFTVFLLVCFLRLLITGALKWWGAPRGLSIASFIFSILLYGIPLGISLFYNFASKPTGVTVPTFSFIFPAIYLGTSLLMMICLCINYSAGFKNKEFIPNELYLDNYVAMMTGEERKHSYPGNVITIPPQDEPSTDHFQSHFLKKEEEEKQQKIVVEAAAPAPAVAPVVVNVTTPEPKKEAVKTQTITKFYYETKNTLPPDLKAIGGHAFSQNTTLEIANIPSNITDIGNSAFSNCVSLRVLEIPSSVSKIGYNAFFHCPKLKSIHYSGTMKQWKKIKRGSNWLANCATTIVICNDGALSVNPYK